VSLSVAQEDHLRRLGMLDRLSSVGIDGLARNFNFTESNVLVLK
jgi:hypothetical protein